jgi:subtilisin family serine protease
MSIFLPTISPAFRPFLASSGPDDKRDAIVVYRSPAAAPQIRGRLRKLKRRLDDIKARASEQQATADRLFSSFREQRPPGSSLDIERIGKSLPFAHAEITPKMLPALAAQPDVVAILPNQRVRLIGPRAIRHSTLMRNESTSKMTWGLKELGIPDLWKTTKGADINVAVLDTGVYGDHEALKGRVKHFVLIDPLGRRITTSQTFDASNHGTHVCGTIAGGKTPEGVAIGVAPEANLLVAGVLLAGATVLSLLQALDWAVEHEADIVSMSLGLDYYEPKFAEIFRDLLAYGILPVVAIGNENHGNTSSPGSADNALSVGAVEKMPSGKAPRVDVAFFSSGASLEFPGSSRPIVTKPDVVAPGVQIYSCAPPEKTESGEYLYVHMDGTSSATPHVAGVAALLMSARPDVPVTRIMDVLKETAIHPHGQRPDNRWGHGMIQPAAALKAL